MPRKTGASIRDKGRELPQGQEVRNRLYRQTLVVEELLFAVGPPTPWLPPLLPVSSGYASPGREAADGPPAGLTMTIVDPLREYNLRLAEIARRVHPVIPQLVTAGLPVADRTVWDDHRLAADAVLRDPGRPPPYGGHLLFVHARSWPSVYGPEPHAEEQVRDARVLASSRVLIDRLARAVRRVMQTVSPRAVLERVHLSEDLRVVTIDGIDHRVLPKSDGIYLYHLRLGLGDYVSGDLIEQAIGREINVSRIMRRWGEQQSQLLEYVEVVQGRGGRLVLPLPE